MPAAFAAERPPAPPTTTAAEATEAESKIRGQVKMLLEEAEAAKLEAEANLGEIDKILKTLGAELSEQIKTGFVNVQATAIQSGYLEIEKILKNALLDEKDLNEAQVAVLELEWAANLIVGYLKILLKSGEGVDPCDELKKYLNQESEKRLQEVLAAAKQEEAAKKIQKVFRGYKARQEVQKLKAAALESTQTEPPPTQLATTAAIKTAMATATKPAPGEYMPASWYIGSCLRDPSKEISVECKFPYNREKLAFQFELAQFFKEFNGIFSENEFSKFATELASECDDSSKLSNVSNINKRILPWIKQRLPRAYQEPLSNVLSQAKDLLGAVNAEPIFIHKYFYTRAADRSGVIANMNQAIKISGKMPAEQRKALLQYLAGRFKKPEMPFLEQEGAQE